MAYNTVYRNSDDLQCADTDWSNQLEMFKIALDVDYLVVKYQDEENEEIGLNSQADYEYALQYAKEQAGFLNLIFKDKSGRVLAKHKFFVNKETNTAQPNPTPDQDIKKQIVSVDRDQWLIEYLEKFKHDILGEIEHRIKAVVLDHSKPKYCETPQLDKAYDINENLTFEEKINKLLKMSMEVKYVERPLKKAYLDEELQLTGAFQAEFVTDVNMPDGTKCSANHRFQKQWLVKNTGKLAWTSYDEKFPVQLICIGGNIATLSNEERVSIARTDIDATVQLNVNLKAPATPGEFYTEWALVCRGFQFGPRLWCTIEVVEPQTNVDNEINSFSEDEEFVVVPDCLDLTKKWSPPQACQLVDQNLANELEISYFEVSSQIAQKMNDLSAAYQLVEQNDIDHEETGNNLTDFNTVENNHKELLTPAEDTSILKVIINNETENEQKQDDSEEPAVKKTNALPEDNANNEQKQDEPEEPAVKKTYALPEDNAKTSFSRFDIIRNSFANLKGPSNIGDTKLDLTTIQNSIPEAASAVRNNLPSPTVISSSVSQITNAFGSLGSLGSFYQNANEREKNMNTLISMGFANRTLNNRLLNKHKNDMNKVLHSLLEKTDNDWHEHR